MQSKLHIIIITVFFFFNTSSQRILKTIITYTVKHNSNNRHVNNYLSTYLNANGEHYKL